MATLGKTLMDIYYAEERKWLKLMDTSEDESLCMEISFAYSNAESMVNNLKHGRQDSDWVPQFVQIMRERASESVPAVAEHFEIIASLAEDAIS
jgi:hypothetical protein